MSFRQDKSYKHSKVRSFLYQNKSIYSFSSNLASRSTQPDSKEISTKSTSYKSDIPKKLDPFRLPAKTDIHNS